MKLCVSMWSMHRKFYDHGWSVLDFLRFCANHGIDCVELLDVFWRDIKQELPAVKQFLAEHSIQVGAYAVTNDFVHEDAKDREQALGAVLAGLPVAQELDTRVIRVFAGDAKPDIDFTAGFQYIVDGLRAAAEAAKERGLTLALENHGRLAGRGEQVEQILDAVGSRSLGAAFDTGNFILVGQSSLAALDTLLPRVVHVHAKDFRPVVGDEGYPAIDGTRYQSVVCGEGLIPLSDIVSRLQQSGYAGSVSIEYEGGRDEEAGVIASLNALRRWIQTSSVQESRGV
ncbi:MAG: sugar phosphate isomerase/epimerase [Alicyclobacillus herbarius]|uniref:sugar phosphate isomerase/epimerase family protein n=1 Tax=Alicyclobacillus herbarius TaxID=122960 RepID=UPI0023540789|nr:sugar phosphate isomerase/epimerase family protein [Alicyclobacillus herbarius]MCL6632156.1 sugar phosphate isomerase/epimerase [Alicyclobacillus herbarius]